MKNENRDPLDGPEQVVIVDIGRGQTLRLTSDDGKEYRILPKEYYHRLRECLKLTGGDKEYCIVSKEHYDLLYSAFVNR